MSTINERLKDVRKRNRLTLADFGARIGYHPTTVSQIERGIKPYEGRADDRYIITVSNVFKVSEHWIRTGEGEPDATVPPADASAMRAQLVISMYRELSPKNQAMLIELAKALIAEESEAKKRAEKGCPDASQPIPDTRDSVED